MSMDSLHPWADTPEKAAQQQADLRSRLKLTWDGRRIITAGGVGLAGAGDGVRAAIAVLSYPELQLMEAATAELHTEFPYIAGLLAFRVGPAISVAWEKLATKPDVLMLPGHGTAHPRGCGLACHIGWMLNNPTIGIAKERL